MTAELPQEASQTLDIKEIIKILPHRYPFLLIDRILELKLNAGKIVARKNLTINEPFFQGHFPDNPIMPGVLILEALAQAGGVLVHLRSKGDKAALLVNIREAKFRHPVRPGDVLTLTCDGIHFSSKGGKVLAQAHVGTLLACEAEIWFALVDKSQI